MEEVYKIQGIKTLKKIIKDPKVIIEALSLLNDTVDIEEVIGDLKMHNTLTGQVGFKSKCFLKFEKEENLYLNLLESPEIEEGMFQCIKCQSKKIMTMSKQTRSGDEAITVFAKCSQCNNNWIIS